ncbi:MAG: arginine--tRNA ligase [Bacteroidales bacterium]|nr:arginine--tRNA ligase [Bacteroidales bacterium]HOI31347.1 arginine--tRNA ligase [Bacteroidales bacterium]
MLENNLKETLLNVFKNDYHLKINPELIGFQQTRAEFEGDLTLVVFPFLKLIKKNPAMLADELGSALMAQNPLIKSYNVIKGFLNLSIQDDYWLKWLADNLQRTGYEQAVLDKSTAIVIEYSSPNTNKPLHLGHIRNNLLGWSVAEILKANGGKVIKVNLVNDRGIHICKSMLAWQKFGEGKTPESTGIKGDKLVGEMYVAFDKAYKSEQKVLITKGYSPEDAAKNAPLIQEAQLMLRQWENGEQETRELWETMNNWVYSGFDVTYTRLGIDFDKIYYESETYLLGKQIVMEGLAKSVFFKKNDGSVWCDLSAEGLDEKLLLRADGTSVYMTQDIGTAQLRYDDYKAEKLIYVVGNEQNYHFDVLQKILLRLEKAWASGIEHLSYGMVELPEGKMKSREGTVVDADDLMDEMFQTAKKMSEELGKGADLPHDAAEQLYNDIGLAALKYYMLRVDPRKTMMFNPAESIDFNGNTGPFIQYTHARIKSVLRKAVDNQISWPNTVASIDLMPKEKAVITLLHTWNEILRQAAINRSPALIANFLYELAKTYNQFYQDNPILRETDSDRRCLRLQISDLTARMLKYAGGLLGIQMPEKM